MKITTIVDYIPSTGLLANVVLHLVDDAESKARSFQQRNSYTLPFLRSEVGPFNVDFI